MYNGNSPNGSGGTYSNQGSLSRNHTPHNSLPRSNTPQQQQKNTGGNLSELDSLLQDLSSARYGSNIGGPQNGTASPSQMHTLNDSYKRPSVDSLLDELSNANSTAGPIYAVPNGYLYLHFFLKNIMLKLYVIFLFLGCLRRHQRTHMVGNM